MFLKSGQSPGKSCKVDGATSLRSAEMLPSSLFAMIDVVCVLSGMGKRALARACVCVCVCFFVFGVPLPARL